MTMKIFTTKTISVALFVAAFLPSSWAQTPIPATKSLYQSAVSWTPKPGKTNSATNSLSGVIDFDKSLLWIGNSDAEKFELCQKVDGKWTVKLHGTISNNLAALTIAKTTNGTNNDQLKFVTAKSRNGAVTFKELSSDSVMFEIAKQFSIRSCGNHSPTNHIATSEEDMTDLEKSYGCSSWHNVRNQGLGEWSETIKLLNTSAPKITGSATTNPH
jgi:hypothetical protein